MRKLTLSSVALLFAIAPARAELLQAELSIYGMD
jgi:hypothetical protein